MGLVGSLRKKKAAKVKARVTSYGLTLLAFNLTIAGGLFFALAAISSFIEMLRVQGIAIFFVPLVAMLLFAASSGVGWYRFGQVVRDEFKKDSRLFYAGMIVLLSVIPLFIALLFLAALMALTGNGQPLVAAAFTAMLLVTILASTFELIAVSLGVMTKG